VGPEKKEKSNEKLDGRCSKIVALFQRDNKESVFLYILV